jgi:hypothetical protein
VFRLLVVVGDTSGGRHSVLFGRSGVCNFVCSLGGVDRIRIMCLLSLWGVLCLLCMSACVWVFFS